MQLEGSLNEIAVAPLLERVGALGKTGILTIHSESDIIAVTFLDGRIVAADALNEPIDEGLGQVLISQGLLTEERFTGMLEDARGASRRLSHHLVERAVVGRDQVLEAVRLQTYRLLLRLLRWNEGEWNIFVGDEISYEDGIRPIAVEEVLVRAQGDLGDESPVDGVLPELETTWERSPDTRTIKILGIDGDTPSGDETEVWVTAAQHALLRESEGGCFGTSLLTRAGLDEYEVRWGLSQLRNLGMVNERQQTELEVGEHTLGGGGLGSLDDQVRDPLRETGSHSFLGDTDASLGELLSGAPVEAEADFLRDTGSFGGLVPPPPTGQRPVSAGQTGVHEKVTPPPKSAAPSRHKARSILRDFVDVWLGRTMALGFFLVVVLAFALMPDRNGLFFPYPWQERQREAFESAQRASQAAKLDRAVRSYYLLYGRFPERLGALSALELLSPNDQVDSRGRQLQYSSAKTSYTLQPLRDGQPVPGLERTYDVAEDFLLSPEFVRVQRNERSPVVLLD